MLKHLLNDSAVLKTPANIDEYGNVTTFTETTINCKFEFAVLENFSSVSSAKSYSVKMFCLENVNVGDLIFYNSDNFQVIQVNVYDDFDGNSMFREVYLK